MSIRSFIRLNFKEDCYCIYRYVPFRNDFLFLTKKEVNDAVLDSASGGCELRYKYCFSVDADNDYSSYPGKVLVNFMECFKQSKIRIDYPRSVIFKMLRKKESLPYPKDDFKIYFIYSNASHQYSLSAFIHAEDENEAKDKFRAHFLQLKKEHPIKYKELKCRFSIVHSI